MANTFFYEDGQENVYNDLGIKVFDPMEDVLTQITDPNVVLETIATQSSYLEARKSIEERNVKKSDDVEPKAVTKPKLKQNMYNDYSDNTREVFIDRMLESAEERGRIVRFAKELGVEPRTARRWWKRYQETNEVPYKLSKNNVGRPSSFTTEHETYIRELLDKDPQLYSEDIIGELSKEFMGFSISKTQLNHHLRNNMLVTIKKPTFEPGARNSTDNLETRYEWFMKWKDSDVDFTKNCVFIDEAGFHINLRNNWARADTGTPAIVKTTKTKTPSHTIIGAIHASSVIHVAIKKPPPKKEKLQSNKASTSKKRKVAKGKKHTVDGFIIEEPATEYVDDNNESSAQDSSESISKGTTTAHFIKFMNVLLDIMDLNEDLKGNYLVMDNCTIHKSKPMMRKIESRGYKLIYLPPYSPELNPIEQFWAILKGKLKRHKLLNEEKMSDRIAEACNAIPAEILYNFASHSKRQIIQCYNKTPF